MLNSLVSFIVRYEYARALFDKRAAARFGGEASDLFLALAKIEVNHATKLEALLPERIVPPRSKFFEKQDHTIYNNLCIDGISKRHIWTRFLFDGKTPSDWELHETLAFCAAAERLEAIGYFFLGFLPKLRTVSRTIALEESNAEKRIIAFLFKVSTFAVWETRLLVFKWYLKAFFSMVILAFTRNK